MIEDEKESKSQSVSVSGLGQVKDRVWLRIASG